MCQRNNKKESGITDIADTIMIGLFSQILDKLDMVLNENEFDYNNTLDQFGDLNWEAINNSKYILGLYSKTKIIIPLYFYKKT